MSKTFLIVGDSWSQGEIEYHDDQEQTHQVSHRGLNQYLEDAGHTVYNRGGLGWANVEAYWRTYSAFFDHTNCGHPEPIEKDIDYIIWFTTDSFRDLTQEQYLEKILEYKSIRKTFIKSLEEGYQRFNELSSKIQKPIYLIGGWVPVLDTVNHYSNLRVLIRDVHQLLVPESQISITHPALQLYEYVKQTADYVKNKLSSGEIDFIKNEIIELTDEWTYALNIRAYNKPLFWPDCHHANRQGHYKMFEHIIKELNLE